MKLKQGVKRIETKLVLILIILIILIIILLITSFPIFENPEKEQAQNKTITNGDLYYDLDNPNKIYFKEDNGSIFYLVKTNK